MTLQCTEGSWQNKSAKGWAGSGTSVGFGESVNYLSFPFSSLIKDTSPVPLIDVTNLPTPRKFLDTSQYSTPGSSSGKYLIL